MDSNHATKQVLSSAVPIGSSWSPFIVSTLSPSVWRMNAIWRRIVGFVWALVTISDAVSPFRLVAGASVYWCSVGIHCVAIAAAIPVYVLLRRLARSSAGLSFASAFDRPVTSLLGTSGGRFFRNKAVALVCPWPCCQGCVYWVGLVISIWKQYATYCMILLQYEQNIRDTVGTLSLQEQYPTRKCAIQYCMCNKRAIYGDIPRYPAAIYNDIHPGFGKSALQYKAWSCAPGRYGTGR